MLDRKCYVANEGYQLLGVINLYGYSKYVLEMCIMTFTFSSIASI